MIVKNKKAYQKSSIICPMCGQKTVQRVFRCRSAEWYGWHALRFYCINGDCPIDVACTLYFDSKEAALERFEEDKEKGSAK